MKRFNYTGICIPEKHYMVDTSAKIEKIKRYIDNGDYFAINRPRQYGKTTTIFLLENALRNDYLLISISFESKGEESFKDIPSFSKVLINNINHALKLEGRRDLSVREDQNIFNFDDLSYRISDLIIRAEKKVVLFIDEVDQASNYELFLKFLGMLRSKYLSAAKNKDHTFHSVVLAGVHDIKNIKMKMRDEREIQYNSPWNIAVDFNIDLSFSPEEILTMLIEYEEDQHTGMDIKTISEKLYEYTSGYPYLVSKVCYLIAENLDKDFSEEGIEEALKILLNESNTLFDDLIKNINKYEELYDLLKRIVLDGEEISFNVQAHTLGIMYGVFKENKNRKLGIHNKIFEILFYNYLIAKQEIKKGSPLNYKYSGQFTDSNGDLKMELVLLKFQELMKAEYRKIDEKFVEREGRLLFLAFLKPIINGIGFYFVEPETRMSNRMDIVVTYHKKKYVIELKIWRGGKYEQEGREQLSEYLEAQNLHKGYMVFYNFNKGKEYRDDLVMLNGKEIFEVIV
jgi:hypothetical protein